MNFAHILPTPHLNLVNGRPFHLTLAHLVEADPEYTKFYQDQKEKYKCLITLDNSAFEKFKQGEPMYPPEKLIDMGKSINADYIVMSDYPGEDKSKTIEAAEKLAPEFKAAGFGTFFVPQGETGNIQQLLQCFQWAADRPELVDYIGVSILAAPLAYDVEKGNKLQRFVSRLKLMYALKEQGILDQIKTNSQKIHILGMLDGPNEIIFMNPFKEYIDTWDSSAAGWLGLNGQTFDYTPTGRREGKFEVEVNFDFETSNETLVDIARTNMEYIDSIVSKYLGKF